MQKKNQNLVNQCCTLYELELSEFYKRFNLKESTLKTWRKILPSYRKLLLEKLIENYNLKRELEIKADKLSKLQSLLLEEN